MAKKLLTSDLPFQGIEGFKQTQKKSNFSLNGLVHFDQGSEFITGIP